MRLREAASSQEGRRPPFAVKASPKTEPTQSSGNSIYEYWNLIMNKLVYLAATIVIIADALARHQPTLFRLATMLVAGAPSR
jgi:hypothetical protein